MEITIKITEINIIFNINKIKSMEIKETTEINFMEINFMEINILHKINNKIIIHKTLIFNKIKTFLKFKIITQLIINQFKILHFKVI